MGPDMEPSRYHVDNLPHARTMAGIYNSSSVFELLLSNGSERLLAFRSLM